MLLEYYFCCWCKKVETEEEDLMYEMDILEKEFIRYKELRKKKADTKRIKKNGIKR